MRNLPLLFVLAACHSSPSPPAIAPPKPVVVAPAPVVEPPAPVVEAPAAAPPAPPPPPPPFSSEAWLHERGNATWKHDASCWSKQTLLPGKPEWMVECACDESVGEWMICRRDVDVNARAKSATQRMVIYGVDKGSTHVVFDAATRASAWDDGEPDIGAEDLGSVNLEGSLDGADLVLTDDRCPELLAKLTERKHAGVRAAFTRVCALAGHWRLVGGRLVHQPAKR